MKRAALYMRVSTLDQHPETQMHDLHEMAKQRGYQIVQECTDMISGAKARRRPVRDRDQFAQSHLHAAACPSLPANRLNDR